MIQSLLSTVISAYTWMKAINSSRWYQWAVGFSHMMVTAGFPAWVSFERILSAELPLYVTLINFGPEARSLIRALVSLIL
jgi:hypothetical protein